MKKLILLDGMNLIFRSYYATAASGNLMQNSQGLTTNAVYGFVSAFQQILQMEFTDILVAFDSKGPTHRHIQFQEYKGTRKEAPIELLDQIPLVKEYLDAAGIPRYEQDTYEADDIIGHIVKHHKADFDHITILSNDRDLLQLIGPNVTQMVSRKGFSEVDLFTPDSMLTVMGFRPDQMPDYKGLVGDTSDNIPGVPGIGDKTAVKLLQEYGSIEGLYEGLDKLSGKLKEKLESNRDVAFFSKHLATILCDFDNTLPPRFEYKGPDYGSMAAFLKRMEFHTFLRRFEQATPRPAITVTSGQSILDPAKIPALGKEPAAVHLELFGWNYHTAVKLGFAVKTATLAFYVPYEVAILSKPFLAFLANPIQQKYVYDWKAQKVALLWAGFDFEGIVFDLKLSAYLINPNNTKEDFRVVSAAFDYHDVKYDEEVYGKGAKFQIPDSIETIANHAISKATAIFKLVEPARLKNQEYGQSDLLEKVELPLARTLAKMEYAGISIDEAALDEFGGSLYVRLQALEQEIYRLAGQEFNINSPKQLGVVLFESLNLPYYKKTKSGYSTDAQVLEQLLDYHPVVKPIMEYRTVSKLHSTYYEGLKTALAMKSDGKIHTIYQQTIAQTGRLSSIEPNLQNIPIRTEEGKELRKIFIAKPNQILLSCDYSQIELRVLAEMGNCQSLKDAFQKGEDIHTHTARLIFHKQDVTANERRQAKAINFGIIYGKTPWGLSDDLGISLKQAEEFIKNYFEYFPEIKAFMDAQIRSAVETGYVTTKFSRRRYIPEVKDANYQVREFGKRMAMNAPIQGTAADLLKIAMVEIQRVFEAEGLKSELLLQIHDELVFDVVATEQDRVAALVKDILEHAAPFSVPLSIESGFGVNLYEVK